MIKKIFIFQKRTLYVMEAISQYRALVKRHFI